MTIDEIKEKVNGQEYEFLKNDEHLGSNIILLGLGGSYSYGMSIEGKSDVDIRGVSLNGKEEILLGQEQREQPIPEFYELLHELEKRMAYDEKNTSLPERSDYKNINEFWMDINEWIVTGK